MPNLARLRKTPFVIKMASVIAMPNRCFRLNSINGKLFKGKPIKGKPTKGKLFKGKPTKGKPTKGKPTKGKPTEGKQLSSPV